MPKRNSAAVCPVSAHLRKPSIVVQQANEGRRPTAAEAALKPSSFEPLEPRQLLSVSTDSAGFTVVTPPSGAKVIYVSASGNDGNSGLSTASPVRSLGKAKKMLRSGAGDQLLLKRGDSFRDAFGFWNISGKDASNPVVIGTYGSGARPRIETGSSDGLLVQASIHDLFVSGVNFVSSSRGSSLPDGIKVNTRSNGLKFEDIKVEGYRNNITLQSFFGTISNVTIRRSVIVDAWSSKSHSQGLYAEGVKGITLEENIFDHNGWRGNSGASVFNHNAYVTATSSGLVARNNVFANASSHGLQARPGGTVTGNLFYNNAVGLTFGLVNGGGPVTVGGVSGTVSGNVFMGGHNYSNLVAGVAMEISNTKGATVSNNLIANGPKSENPAIVLSVSRNNDNPTQQVGINNLSITNNVIYNWQRGISISGGLDAGKRGPSGLNNLVVKNNDFQVIRSFQAVQNFAGTASQSWSGNRYNVPNNSRTPVIIGGRALSISGFKSIDSGAQDVKVSYPAASRTMDSYASDFLSRARGQSRSSWDPRYTASAVVSYLKGGFSGGSLSSAPVIAPPKYIVASPTPTPTNSTSDSRTGTGSTSSSTSGVSVSIGDARITEGDSGTRPVNFTFRLSGKSSKSVTVRWETKGESARVGSDYVGRNGTLTFSPGQTSKTVSIKVKGDRAREANETFVVNALSVSGASVSDGQGRATVIDND